MGANDGYATHLERLIGNARLADMAQDTLKGRNSTGTGSPEDLTAAEVKALLNYGDLADLDTVSTAYLDNDAVSNTKLADMDQATIKGRASGAGTGDPVDLTAAQVRTIINVEDGADVTDATNVAAAGAVMDSDFSANGRMIRTGAGTYTTVLDKLDATAAPAVGDDENDGYAAGSLWVDVTNDKAYVCLDASAGAADWKEITGGGGGSGITTYADVATAEAASGSDDDLCYVVATQTLYRYEATGSAYTDNDTSVLSTGDGGDTRWLGVAGQYQVTGLNPDEDLTLADGKTINVTDTLSSVDVTNDKLLIKDDSDSDELKEVAPEDCLSIDGTAISLMAPVEYNSTAGQTIPTATHTIVDFETKVTDDDNTVTTGASWKFTAPKDMSIHLEAMAVFDTVTMAAGEVFVMQAYVNGTTAYNLYYNEITDGEIMRQGLAGGRDIHLSESDYVDVRLYQNSGGDADLRNAAKYVWVTIHEIPTTGLFDYNRSLTPLTPAGNYTVTTSDTGKLLSSGSMASGFIWTMPSVTDGDEPLTFHFVNPLDRDVTIQPGDTNDRVGYASGAGYGIVLGPGASCTVTADIDGSGSYDCTWQVYNAQGMVRPEGMVLHCRCDEFTVHKPDWSADVGRYLDLTGRHILEIHNGLTIAGGISDVGAGSWNFPGNDEYVQKPDSTDWDIDGSSGEDWTIHIRVYFDNAAGSKEYIYAQYEDGSNRWYLVRQTDGALDFSLESGGTAIVELRGTTATAASTWYDVTVCRVGTTWGIYIDGSQEDYDTCSTYDTFAGDLYIGQNGSGSYYFDGKIDEKAIANQNLFDADPQSDDSDSITIPDSYLTSNYAGDYR